MKLLYDAGVGPRTRGACLEAGCELKTSGIIRNSKESDLSWQQRVSNYDISVLRIRVENFIGVNKARYAVLKRREFKTEEMGMMDEVIFTCYMLRNFGPPIIH